MSVHGTTSFKSLGLAENVSVPLKTGFFCNLFFSTEQFYWSAMRSYPFLIKNGGLNFQLSGQRSWSHWRAVDIQQLRLQLAALTFTGFKVL